ncbi:MAG TPA: ClpXP protease specificity-enhancing factor SspB [Alphaproteobacteria bacterium]|nr:ClpXP protease specificity-enhancing factor SspB [Alphaproteobacteria bacterium]
MAKQILQYNQMVEEALRAVVRRALSEVAEYGLPDGHHFYITFRTTFPGVTLANYLRERYPTEMTIVLQHQFEGLEVDEDSFAVTVKFSNKSERLVIPLRAITVFADPSVNFALPLHAAEQAEEAAPQQQEKSAPASSSGDGKDKAGEVVSLDQFRRK